MSSEKGVRWCPAIAIVLLAGGGLTVTWMVEIDRQSLVMRSLAIVFVASVFLLLWVAAFSRLRRRGTIALGLVLLAVGIGFLVRVVGVDGDLLPVLEWRWQQEIEAPLVGAGTSRRVATSPQDFPQFLGQNRDGKVDTRIATDWSATPPRERWRQPVGPGWSGFAIVGDLAITHSQNGEDEVVLALDLATGAPLWSHTYPARYDTTIGGPGPRTVPTVAEGRVFALGATGILTALDVATGKPLWQHDVIAEAGATVPDWGKTGAPLVVGELVIVSAGGLSENSLVAYDVEDGEPRWSAGSDTASYSAPTLLELDGVSQVVVFNQATVNGHDPTDGRVLWRVPVPEYQPNVASPVALDANSLYLTTGYGIGGRRLEVRRDAAGEWRVEEVWESPRLKSKFANVIFHRNVLYGLDDGVLVAIDPATGDRYWKQGRYGHGQLLLVGEDLLVQSEKGELVLLQVDSEGPQERSRYPVFSGKTWNPPALSGNILLMRNDEIAVALELPRPIETARAIRLR